MSYNTFKAAQHMEGLLDPKVRGKLIAGTLKIIRYREKKHNEAFDAIAYRGASGAITASIIAHHLRKPLILVRKPEDTKGHSPYQVEGPRTVKMYLIVDDFMSSGATYDAIREAVEKEHPHAECLGMLEVAYAANDGEKTYRKSHNHKEELERRQRMVEGKAIASDIEWATREQPITPTVIFKTEPVCILKDSDGTYKFGFENNQQKLLTASSRGPDHLVAFMKEFSKWFRLETVKPRPMPRENWPMSRFFYNPYDQKQQQQQTSPEATGSAATEG